MFIYLSKKIKIAIPHPIDLESVAWNREQGWIACGGRNGTLKVLKLEDGKGKKDAGGNLTMNQTLEGHNGAVRVLHWNEQYRKLTTSDQYGLIIVWILFKGQWTEEMINNRNKSVVRDMRWNFDGQRICIIYEDGAVIVGSVDGHRIWGQDLKQHLAFVEWSPNGKQLVFGTVAGEVLVYSNDGTPIGRIATQCLEGASGVANLAGIEWYNGTKGYVEPDCPCLAICYENGRAQIMRSETDPRPVLIDTLMKVVRIQWNDNGSVLAVAGARTTGVGDGDANAVQFYNPFGEHLRTLKVPGKSLRAASWEGSSLRLALAVDHFIYFANVRLDYKWGYFAGTVVYAFNKPDRAESCVVFWDTKLNGRFIKFIKNLIGIAAAGDHCVMSTRADDVSGQYVLILCNAIGTPIDSKYIDIEPVYVDMTPTHVVAASRECVYVWHYKGGKFTETEIKKRRNEKIFHVDDSPSGGAGKDDITKFRKAKTETRDQICCVCTSDRTLMVGRESGLLQQYSLPRVSLDMKHALATRPEKIALNCTSTRLAVIDYSGVLTFYDPEVKKTSPETGEVQYGEHIKSFERKDVWDMKWATDNPELFAMMEKTYMYIFRDLDPEEPIQSSAHICHFQDLEIRSVQLDELLKDPEHPTRDYLLDMDIKSLRDTRVLLENVGIEDTYAFVEQNPHPRLWRLLAEAALSKPDLAIAEKAFVRSKDFQGIEFVRRLHRLDDPGKQAAEVAVYFRRFEEAERLYQDMDRRDLAVAMRAKLGDWFRVVQLIKHGAAGDDKMLERAWNSIGDYYADRQRWSQALKYYVQGRNQRRLAECFYRLEDYEGLENLIHSLPEGHELLSDIASMFATVGMCKQAVAAFTKTGKIKESIQVCVTLNQWDTAVKLGSTHNIKEIDALLAKYASHLLGKDKKLDAIELYRKANHFLDAAKLLFQIAADTARDPTLHVRAKKLYVLGALNIEAHHEMQRRGGDTRATLDGLLSEDPSAEVQSRLLDSAWRGAEAYHFLLLAQRQLYHNEYAAALRTAVRLTEYDDLLEPRQTYSILALAALSARAYSVCSKAFIKLESLSALTDKQKQAYEALALQIFTKHAPKDSHAGSLICNQCNSPNVEWATSCQACEAPFLCSVVSGKSMVETEFWICDTCKHRATANEIGRLSMCPLCHASFE